MTTSAAEVLDTDVRTLLRAAADELLPVVVDLGPDQARFSSFIVAIEDAGGGAIVLEPIAAEALPERLRGACRITPATPSAGWSITTHALTRRTATSVQVALSRAQLRSNAAAPGPVAVQPTDLLVLVVPGGLHGGNNYVFPVQCIGADVCEIRSDVALEPGRDLPYVELIGDCRLLRRAAAHVLETTPWYAADGSRSYSCRLSLSDELEGDGSDAHDLVTEPAEVKRLVQLAGTTQAAGWFEGPGWARGTLRFVEIRDDHALLELTLPVRTEQPLPRALRIGVEVFATAYELDVRPISVDGDRLRVALPLILRRRRRHRRDQRITVGGGEHVELSFRNPVTGLVQTQRLTELSFFGARFDCASQDMALWASLPLEQAQIAWRNRLVHLGDVVVEEYGRDPLTNEASCTVSIPNSGVADDPEMIYLLATLAHPHVRVDSGQDFAGLHRMYLKAQLFGPHMHRNLAPIFDETSDVWRRLHSHAADVARTFVHGPEEAPDAAVSIVRAWEHAWVLQHFVDTNADLGGATSKLQAAYLDHLVPRPDGRYLLFFIKTDNAIMNAYLRRFFASTGTPDAVARTVVELWSRPADAARGDVPRAPLAIRDVCEDDELVIARAAQRRLGAYATAALSFTPGELHIADTRARFARAGLVRGRRSSIVSRGGSLAYAVIEERSTPGVNLTWMLNATWILPIHPECDPDSAALDAVLGHIVDTPAQSATGEHFLNLPEGFDPERLAAWGFTKEASLYLYSVTRAGLHRLFHYTANRCGEVDARTRNRERRRKER
jgi:hypothetical protein